MDDPDCASKLAVYNALINKRDVYKEMKCVRKDFSLLISVVAKAYGVEFSGYIQKHSANIEMRRRYKIVSAEGYQLFGSTLREPFDAPYNCGLSREGSLGHRREGLFLCVCAGRNLTSSLTRERQGEGRTGDRGALLSSLLGHRPCIAIEEFLEKLPGPTVDEVGEPMRPSSTSKDASADIPQSEMAGSSNQDASVPKETDAPESSPRGEASGVKVEKTEGSPQGEESGDKDVHMADAGDMAKGRKPQGEAPMPDRASSIDVEGDEVLHDQDIWGQQKNRCESENRQSFREHRERQREARAHWPFVVTITRSNAIALS